MSFSWALCGSWLLHSAVAGGALLLLTHGLARFVRQPARRQRLCETGLFAALSVAVLNLVLPGWLLVPQPGTAHFARGVSAPAGLMPDAVPPTVPNVVQTPNELDLTKVLEAKAPSEPIAAAGESTDPEPSLGETVLFWSQTWLLPGIVVGQALGALLFLVHLLIGHVALSRILSRARPAPADVIELFRSLIGKGRPPRLLISDRVRVPLSCGLLRPTVVLPSELCGPANAKKLRWIFAHELTHLQRRDAWSCLLFCIGQALYFYVPWFWWLRRQARLCQEFVADAVAALEEVPPISYAEFLVSLTRAPAVPMAATGVSGQSSDLFRRVDMLLQNPMSVERDCPRHWSMVAAGGLLGLAVVLSGISLTANPAHAQQEEVIVQRSATSGEASKEVVVQGQPVRITIYVEGGDKKEPVVIRKGEPVKVYVVPSGDKAKKDDKILYITPKVIIEEKGDPKKVKEGTFFMRFGQDPKPAKTDAKQEPVRKGRIVINATDPQARITIVTDPKTADAPIRLHGTLRLEGELRLDDLKTKKGMSISLPAKDVEPRVRYLSLKQPDVNLDKIRKALEKLEKIPNVDTEQIRREVMKALEQLQKVRPQLEDIRIEIEKAAPRIRTIIEKEATERRKEIERELGLERKQTAKKPEGAEKMQVEPVDPRAKTRKRAVEALANVQRPTDHPGRLGIRIDLPDDILADQLNLPKGQGLVVQEVFAKSPAEKAGLKVGDVLLRLNRENVPADLERFPKMIQELEAGKAIEFTIIRKGKRQVIRDIRVSQAPERKGPAADAKTRPVVSEKWEEAIQNYVTTIDATPNQAMYQFLSASGKVPNQAWHQALSHAKQAAPQTPTKKDGKEGVLTTTLRQGDRFTAKHEEGNLVITVVGSVKNRSATEITVRDGTSSNRYNGIDEVPAAFRDKVNHLIDISTNSTAQRSR
jgi:beta-lactamase regulating signal transducer with metallopeptidase domain